MTLAAGTRLGPYDIVAPLGAGGMGEVYRAKDTRLGREVAVKVLPAEVADDPERLRRFEQEARAASAIHHPNLLTVFDLGSHDGTAYLVTELLEGESLRELVRKGPLSPKRAVELATQLAKGLAAAHDSGIVHRDLKPENLFLTRDGLAKILDFGLARIERPELSQANLNDLSTVLETSAGTVLGTVGYMAPEQVRGERADARSDLFSFGVVLHEMLAGANPFRRESVIESLNAILKEEPPELVATPSGASPALARIVARLLEKDPARRFRSAHDLLFALEGLTATASDAVVGRAEGSTLRVRPPRWAVAAGVATAAALAFVGGRLLPRAEPRAAREVTRFEIQPPTPVGFASSFEGHNLALAPDGRTLAYVARAGDKWILHLRDLARLEGRPMPGTEGAESPFWSPDGSAVAFFAGGQLKRLPRGGGTPQVICDVEGSNTGAWGSAGTIVYSQGFTPNTGLFRVPAGGGVPAKLAGVDSLPRWIDFLPDGRRFLFWNRASDSFDGAVFLFDLDTGVRTPLPGLTSQVRYATPGLLLYTRGDVLVAQRFDEESVRLLGDPVPIASGLPVFFNGWASFTVGGRALAYQVNLAPSPLVWRDRHGRELGRVGPAARYVAVRIAPDGRSAAVTRADPATSFTDVWIVDLERGGATRLSDEPQLDYSPAWSPEGDRVIYTSVSPGPSFTPIVRRAADASVTARLPARPTFFWPRAWNRDGIYFERFVPGRDLDLERLSSIDPEQSVPVLATAFGESGPSPSPDGRWLAFVSDESGSTEIELARPEAPGRRFRISRGARSTVPRWRADGAELFYVSAENWLSAVAIGGRETPDSGEPQALFAVDLVERDSFDVSADGQRFLLSPTPPASSLPLTVVLDWQAELPEP